MVDQVCCRSTDVGSSGVSCDADAEQSIDRLNDFVWIVSKLTLAEKLGKSQNT